MPTIANVIPFPPQPAPSPGSYAIAIAILDAGCGPEEIPWLVAGFEHASELEREITAAMATLRTAAVLAAPGPAS